MIPVSTMRGREVALFGLGGSGMATARALVAGGASVTAWDDNPASVGRAAAEGIGTGDLREVDWSRFAALVLAPGVPLTHPKPHWTVELARAAGVEVIGDVELFCRERAATCPEAPFVAITGTNGKSTTTALVAHVLREAGRDVEMGGNIGVPILELEPPATDRIHVVECSSYQIDLAPGLNPSVGVLLNVTPDHLDRHGSFKAYAAIKERLVAASNLAVVGIDDEATHSIADRLVSRNLVAVSGTDRLLGTLATSESGKLQSGFFVEDGKARLAFTMASAAGDPPEFSNTAYATEIADIGSIASLRGVHNAQNVAAALGVLAALSNGDPLRMFTAIAPPRPTSYVDYPKVADAMADAAREGRDGLQAAFASFPGLPHRMEQVADVGGLIFINDSKATNADAAAPALSSFPLVHWIAGGLPKDGGIEPLRPLFSHVARAYLIGEAAPAFAATLGDTVPYEISGTLDVAVEHAARDARDAGGGVVLFSPAAASFDQYRNFEERGNAFKAAVAALED